MEPHSSVFVGLHERLRRHQPAIAFTDGDDPRVLDAARLLVAAGIVQPTLIGHTSRGAGEQGVGVVEVALGADPLLEGLAMLRDGTVEGLVGGASRPSADIVRAALKTVGMRQGVDLVSSCFLMILEHRGPVVFADCAVVPEPSAAQLATIARTSAHTFHELTGDTPRVAMLSFSTHGSAAHPSVDRVREATAQVRQAEPEIVVDGELQFDAAFVEEVGHRKAPGSPVAGHANVFVFPSLDAGNIAYKIAERVGGATALGPLLQGLAAPVHDLSRGCSVEDIFEIATIAGLQALELHQAA